jgi:predicted permease
VTAWQLVLLTMYLSVATTYWLCRWLEGPGQAWRLLAQSLLWFVVPVVLAWRWVREERGA